jgi:hypothetical protein
MLDNLAAVTPQQRQEPPRTGSAECLRSDAQEAGAAWCSLTDLASSDPERWTRFQQAALAHGGSLDRREHDQESQWRPVLDAETDRPGGSRAALSCRYMSWGPDTSEEGPDLPATADEDFRHLLKSSLAGIVSHLGGGLTIEAKQAHVLKSVPLRPALGGVAAGPAQGWHHHKYWSCLIALEEGTAVDFAVTEGGVVAARTIAVPLGHAVIFSPGTRHRGRGYAHRHLRVQAALHGNGGLNGALRSEDLEGYSNSHIPAATAAPGWQPRRHRTDGSIE